MPTAPKPKHRSTPAASRTSRTRVERLGDDAWIGPEAMALSEAVLDRVLTPAIVSTVLAQPDMAGFTAGSLREALRDGVVYPAWVERLRARKWPHTIQTEAARTVWMAESAPTESSAVDPAYVETLDETGKRALLAKILLATPEEELASVFQEAIGRPVTHAELRAVLPPEVTARLASV